MMARTHIVVGGIGWLAVASLAHIAINPAHVVLAMGASLLPDMDHPKSVFGKMIYPVSGLIGGIFGHRGITHSALAVLVLVVAMLHYGVASGHIVSAVAVGYLSHLLADWLTPSGVPLLYPSMRRYSSPLTVKTGGAGELLFLCLMFSGLVLYFSHAFP